MSDIPTRRAPLPVLHPVVELKIAPARKEAAKGGKTNDNVIHRRLDAQREALTQQVADLVDLSTPPAFGHHMLLVAEMFADSFAPTKAPRDLLRGLSGSLLRQGTIDGYLVEAHKSDLLRIERRLREGMSAPVRCDISRVKRIRLYGPSDIYRGRSVQSLWNEAPELDAGRAFHIWLAPFFDLRGRSAVLEKLRTMQNDRLLLPTTPQMLLGNVTDGGVAIPDQSERQTSLAILQRHYVNFGHGRALVQIPSADQLQKVVESGGVFRIDPMRAIHLTAPGEGEEPGPLPSSISSEPIVGVVDGGCTANRYRAAEAWRETPFINSAQADTKHGNQMASVIIHGHEWNNNLPLPELYCRVGIAQAIPRPKLGVYYNVDRLISYIARAVERHPDTKVWNLSWNEGESVHSVLVSPIAHELALIARKHNILFVISAGNRSNTKGDCVAPPADCEAALVVGGRQMALDGRPGNPCPETLCGYGPELQLVPHVTSYSPLRLLGGGTRLGTSFATGLLSSLAAHTFDNLRDPTPDMVRALIISRADLDKYNRFLGWGTPTSEYMPWTCQPGSVTLAFRRNLKPGFLYHWRGIPIPPEMIRGSRLFGKVSLATVHRPMCNADCGPNYITSRVAAAVQYPNSNGKFVRLVGAKEEETTPEMIARREEYKWQPVRRDCLDFRRSGKPLNGTSFQIFARAYARNIEQYGYRTNGDIPEIETAFVVTFWDGSNSAAVYNSMVSSLRNLVESAVIDQDVTVVG